MKHPLEKKAIRKNRFSESDVAEKIQAYLHIHAHALFSSLGHLMRSFYTTAMTVVVLAFSISLAGGFYVLVINIQQITGNLETSNQISLFLKYEITDQQGRSLADQLARNSQVQKVKLITKQQALEEFRHYSGFGDALNALEKNPLPTVIQILPKSTVQQQQELEVLLNDLQQRVEVDFAQIDIQWVLRLQSMMELARHGVAVVSFLLAMAVLFIVGNTIRLELHNRRDEVVIAKLVGATHTFIQRPFLYSGFWYGLFAGMTAWVFIVLILLIVQRPIQKLSELYDGSFNVLFLGFFDSFILLSLSSILGVLGAWMVLSYQLGQLKPE